MFPSRDYCLLICQSAHYLATSHPAPNLPTSQILQLVMPTCLLDTQPASPAAHACCALLSLRQKVAAPVTGLTWSWSPFSGSLYHSPSACPWPPTHLPTWAPKAHPFHSSTCSYCSASAVCVLAPVWPWSVQVGLISVRVCSFTHSSNLDPLLCTGCGKSPSPKSSSHRPPPPRLPRVSLRGTPLVDRLPTAGPECGLTP